jgi:hypothetical protein
MAGGAGGRLGPLPGSRGSAPCGGLGGRSPPKNFGAFEVKWEEIVYIRDRICQTEVTAKKSLQTAAVYVNAKTQSVGVTGSPEHFLSVPGVVKMEVVAVSIVIGVSW